MNRISKEIDGKVCVTSAFLAETFRVTVKTLLEWEKQGCPKAARGYWNLAEVIEWREERINGKAASSVEKMSPIQQKIYWETRCKEYQAENQQFRNAILRGDYLEKTEVQKELAVFFATLKQSVLSLPRKCAITAAQYVGNERAREMEKEAGEVMRDVLGQWSEGRFERAVTIGKRKADAKSRR